MRIQRARLLAARRFRADDHVRLERHDAGEAHPDQVVIVDQHQFQLVRHDAPSAPRGRSRIRRIPPRRDAHRQACPRRACRSAAARRRACRRARGSRAGRSAPPGRSRRLRPTSRSRRLSPSARRGPDRNGARMSIRRAPECFSALVSASRPIRSRWCSWNASRRRGDPSTITVPARRADRALSSTRVRERAGEVAAFQRLRAKIHDRPPRFLLAVPAASAAPLPATAARVRATPRGCRRPPPAAARSREPLLERVVQLARHPAALGQHRLILLPAAPRGRGTQNAAPHAPSARIAIITPVCRSVHHGAA